MKDLTVQISQEQLSYYQRMEARVAVGVDPAQAKATRPEIQQKWACDLILKKYDIIRVEDGDLLYCLPHELPVDKNGDPISSTYVKLTDEVSLPHLIAEAYDALGITWTDSKLKETGKTLKQRVPLNQTIKHIDTTLIEVAPGHFWDTTIQEFTTTPLRPCFIRLFDHGEYTPPVSIDFNDIKFGNILLSYKSADAWLNWEDNEDHTLPTIDMVEASDPDDKSIPAPVNIYFPFIDTWACHDHDIYMDIMRMVAAVFMKNKPLGTFILTGVSRNGKGTCAKMIHTLLGQANTSRLRLTDLSKPRLNHTLATTLFNAPDEDIDTKKMTDEDIANWKSMASHEDLILEVFFSQKPRPISTNFVSLSPMNAIPKWKGTHAAACRKRSLIIPFTADLSKFDNKGGKSFEEETFTPEMFESLLGTALALSKYYTEHGLKFSSQMAEEQDSLDESYVQEYADKFVQHFSGYQDIKDVYNDYAIWAKNKGGLPTSLDALKLALRQSGKKIFRTTSVMVGKYYKFGKSNGDIVYARSSMIPGSSLNIGIHLYPYDNGNPNPQYDYDNAKNSVLSFLEANNG